MEMQDILNKYPRPHTDRSNRTAEIAALIVARSAMDSPAENWDSERRPVHVKLPKMIAPHLAAHIATLLVSRSEQLHKLAERDCSHGLLEVQERRKEKIRAQIAEIAKAVGFDVETSGDPRGCVVKLLDPSDKESGDNWGGGWGVYR